MKIGLLARDDIFISIQKFRKHVYFLDRSEDVDISDRRCSSRAGGRSRLIEPFVRDRGDLPCSEIDCKPVRLSVGVGVVELVSLVNTSRSSVSEDVVESAGE